MTKKTAVITFDLAHDSGNGYMKDRIDDQVTIFPSVLARFLPGMQNTVIKSDDTVAVNRFFEDPLQNMDITVQSNGINNNGRYLVGNAAACSGSSLLTFNVSSIEGKNSSDIGIVAALSLISYKALTEYFRDNNAIPSSLDVVIPNMATDLPIDEIKNRNVRESYVSRFMDNIHVVVINNFDNPITVSVTFKKVSLQPEGVIGEKGLILSAEKKNSFRDDEVFLPVKKQYNLDNFDGESLLDSGNVIGIDIGDGTVDFSCMNKLVTLPNMNDSLNMGIGNISEDAIKALHQAYPSIKKMNRQKFMEIANRGDDEESKTFKQFLDEQSVAINQEIIEKVKTLYSRLDQQLGMIVVSGGGAATLQSSLLPALNSTLSEIDVFSKTKIFWVDKKYAQTLNLDGLQARILAMRDEVNE
ncbi:hypothetical protein [Lactobacillus apis]|uniref:Actin-like protein N-terminal domain-containing protein n=1 Tax=Lactobacillus apis TaxID=303541 RepID=A0A0F4LM15_9LACO|nr:hypothetical protein [Lactobacillus apis]KJY59630.1 Uncharacterized protein JF72_14610 [Lactobacillus apis]